MGFTGILLFLLLASVCYNRTQLKANLVTTAINKFQQGIILIALSDIVSGSSSSQPERQKMAMLQLGSLTCSAGTEFKCPSVAVKTVSLWTNWKITYLFTLQCQEGIYYLENKWSIHKWHVTDLVVAKVQLSVLYNEFSSSIFPYHIRCPAWLPVASM